MPRLPTTVAIEHLTSSLRALGEAPARGLPRRIDDLEARLVRAVQRDLVGLPIPDGYPAGSLAGGGRGGPAVADEGVVEAAVIARATEVRDRHHELAVRAVRGVDAAVVGIQTAFAALSSIDDLIKTGPPAPKICDHCTGKRGKSGNRPIYVRGTVGDRLERAKALCEACHSFVRQTAKPGSRAGYLPEDKQISDHEARGRWRIHMSAAERREIDHANASDEGHDASLERGRPDHDPAA